MERRRFGDTGLAVTPLGFGAGGIGDPSLSEPQAARLLNEVLDLGVGLIDTARSYGLSEERIGRHLALRRREFVLSTKVGYGVPGHADWTGSCVEAGVDLALRTLHTDVLDIAHLHSCPVEVLRGGEVAEALVRAVEAGKVRVAAYSGDNEALEWALASGLFSSLQTSINLCDLAALASGTLERARERGLGILAKRPLANAPWRPEPGDESDPAAAVYRERWRRLDYDLAGGALDPAEVALRFSAHLPGVDGVIVGTRSVRHLEDNIAALERGPLPEELRTALLRRFRERGGDWRGMT
jgi:aryl-alcohol dehydrogenase-like predicted oxidoreductase